MASIRQILGLDGLLLTLHIYSIHLKKCTSYKQLIGVRNNYFDISFIRIILPREIIGFIYISNISIILLKCLIVYRYIKIPVGLTVDLKVYVIFLMNK